MLVSEGFYEAENMAGKLQGASNQFKESTGNQKAIYYPRALHELNLCLCEVSRVPEIYNMICVMQLFGLFWTMIFLVNCINNTLLFKTIK